MFSIVAALLAIASSPAPDTSRLDGDRLVVDPIGISFRVPAVWLGQPSPSEQGQCGVGDRIVTDRRRFPRLKNPGGEWTREFAAVVDSVVPFTALVAQLGGAPWAGTCGADQMRIYVGVGLQRATHEALAGVRSARRFFKPVIRTEVDSAGWHVTRLSWQATYYDYGGDALVEFWTRRLRGRDVVLVFMFSGIPDGDLPNRTTIIRSFRERDSGS